MTITILCIDDSKVSRTFIKKGFRDILQDTGVTIEEASNAREALHLCHLKAYDLVTLDLTMPDMSGYDVLSALKQEAIKQKVIVLTADIQPLAEKKVMELGAVGYLEKPFDKENMVTLLKKTGVL
ncbi:response regulator [Desulfoluna sp.]|uniref:response regulator n=1 Tax=Desulfoluna sp. TaxID=2045199 RepID=UPI002632F8AC|nr:response regulator [Desulfoluna sp.]